MLAYLVAANTYIEIARFGDNGILIAKKWIDEPIKIVQDIGEFAYKKADGAAETVGKVGKVGIVKNADGSHGLGLVDEVVEARDELAGAWKLGWNKQQVLDIPKGSRPNPSTYLEQNYIDKHLAKFTQEGIVSRVILKKDFDKYGIGKPDSGKTEFVSRKSEIDEILKLPIVEQSKKLGIPIEQLQGGEVVKIDFKLNSKNKVEMPTGNEFGANPQWIPGGKLPEGNLEAVIKTDGMIIDVDYTVEVIK